VNIYIVIKREAHPHRIEIEKGILKEGKNTVTFLFADSVGETAGFFIPGLKIILRK